MWTKLAGSPATDEVVLDVELRRVRTRGVDSSIEGAKCWGCEPVMSKEDESESSEAAVLLVNA